jgi:Protein of unknown function (DUF3455)
VVRATTLLTLFVAMALITGFAGTASAQGTPTSAAPIPDTLEPPADSVLLFVLEARGVQIYVCETDPNDATAFIWTFKAPKAELLNERGEVVGSHFAGPTWQGQDGSAVIGAVLERADAPDAEAIPWLLLEAKDHEGSGAFSTITHIQRLDTVGGVTPTEGCDEAHAGEEVRAPYEATYAFFYPAMTATPGAATAAGQTGSVTIRVFACPVQLSQSAGQEQPDQAALLAGCTSLDTPETAPTLRMLPDGEPMAGTATQPGVYGWDGLAFGDYAIGGSGEMPGNLSGLLVTDASGAPLQNPVLRIDEMSRHVEHRYFYFLAEATPAA